MTERIDAALADGPLSFLDLAERIYPNEWSWRYAKGGGPPGCFMTLSAALRRGGFVIDTSAGWSPTERIVMPRS